MAIASPARLDRRKACTICEHEGRAIGASTPGGAASEARASACQVEEPLRSRRRPTRPRRSTSRARAVRNGTFNERGLEPARDLTKLTFSERATKGHPARRCRLVAPVDSNQATARLAK